MQKILSLFLLLPLALGLNSCGAKSEDGSGESTEEGSAAELTVPEGAQLVSFNVEGMKCDQMCPPRVEEALTGVTGVSQVGVDFSSQSAKVVCAEDADTGAMVAALKDQGFEASVLP